MPSGLPSLSRIVIKALEIAGAGLTSALVAYLIGRAGLPAAPTSPPVPAVVQLAPADEEMMRSVRNDRAEPTPEPLQIQPAMTASAGQGDIPAAPGIAPVPAPAPESDSRLTSTFKHITAWLLPSRDRTPENTPPGSVPRPPKPIGELWQ